MGYVEVGAQLQIEGYIPDFIQTWEEMEPV